MHNFHIGLVVEAVASDLTDKDIVIHKNEPRNISRLEQTNNRIRIWFDYLRRDGNPDLSLTKSSLVYILGVKRVTGLKEGKHNE